MFKTNHFPNFFFLSNLHRYCCLKLTVLQPLQILQRLKFKPFFFTFHSLYIHTYYLLCQKLSTFQNFFSFQLLQILLRLKLITYQPFPFLTFAIYLPHHIVKQINVVNYNTMHITHFIS